MRIFYILLVWAILAALALAGMTPKISDQAPGAESTGKSLWNKFINVYRASNSFKASAPPQFKEKLVEFPELKQFPQNVLWFLFDSDISNPRRPNVQAVDTLLDNVDNAALRALLLAQQSRVLSEEEAGFYSTIERHLSLAPKFAQERYAQPAIYLLEKGNADLALKLFAAQLNAVPGNGKGKGKEIVDVDVEDEDELERNIQLSKLIYPTWHSAQDTFIYRVLKTKSDIDLTNIIKVQPYKGERANILLGLAIFALKRGKWLLTGDEIDCSEVKTKYYGLCQKLRSIERTDENKALLLDQGKDLLTELQLSDDEFKPEQAAKNMGIITR
ncbi:hypothetical protein IWQ61_006581 [Dispira simplex]|nr:hypothetical protein IWQ61_006581 [Dispira simplex]